MNIEEHRIGAQFQRFLNDLELIARLTDDLLLRQSVQYFAHSGRDLGKSSANCCHSLVRKRKFHPLLKKLGISQCGFHAFRHGNATLLNQIGAPMAVRLNRLGHAEAQTTMGCTHAVTADERRTANALGKSYTLLHEVNKTKSSRNIR